MRNYKKEQINRIYTIIKKSLFLIGILFLVLFCVHLANRVKMLENEVEDLLANQQTLKEASVMPIETTPTTEPELPPQGQNEEVQTTEVLETSDITKAQEQSETLKNLEAIVQGKNIYLTFDDGPSANTNAILDILKEYGVKATFFVNGKTDEVSKAAYKRIVEEGHTLAMHSYTHIYEQVYASKESFLEDLYRLQDYLYDITGVKSKYYRFPGGSSNSISEVDMQVFIEALHEEGIEYFDWNVANGDGASKELTKKEILENMWRDIPLYQHSIILMHDSIQKTSTVEALEEFIEELEAEGYVLLPIDETTLPVQHVKDRNQS